MQNLKDLIDSHGVKAINTYTKYPSIETYHEIAGPILQQNLTFDARFPDDEDVYVTEKVDGTNGRILTLNGDYVIGSREELLHRKGDVFFNPSQNIVEVMKPYAEKLVRALPKDNVLRVFYGEVYGGNINGHKHYTSHKTFGVRFFDITSVNVWSTAFTDILSRPIEAISSWREHGGQNYLSVNAFHKLLDDVGVSKDNRVPYIRVAKGETIPTLRAETYEWLKEFIDTKAALDNDFDRAGGCGKAEGVVVRVEDRSLIRKIRFEDYEKTRKKLGTL